MENRSKKPLLSVRALIARDAVIVGDVKLGPNCSVWFHTVIRGDCAGISIGAGSNIQDNCVLHVDEGFPLTIGEQVSVGHGSVLHGCTIGDNTLIGMGSLVMNGAQIGTGCILGAGSLVTEGTVIPDGALAFGRPARVVRQLTAQEAAENLHHALEYIGMAEDYRREGLMAPPEHI